ncbi:MAG TPA: cation diffusion facilitator family transporter [Gaiellaceae bacterium]|jgi:cobalt-zinc-cadmium efflux system protein
MSGSGHAHHAHARGADDRRALGAALALVLGFAAVEVVGGLFADSLALLADAAHMLSDAFSLALALGASWLAARPASPQRSFGFRRAEILAALVNGLLLVALALWIFVEAARRLGSPPTVDGGTMLAIGAIGLAVNVLAARLLWRASGESLNVRAALRHVFADLLGSVGVVLAAILVLAAGWERADPVVSIVIGALVLASAWGVLRDSAGILLEAAPAGLDVGELGRTMAAHPGVVGVHDLHVWTITSGFPSLSAHVVVEAGADCHDVRAALEQVLHDRFGLDHTTLQVEHAQGLVQIGRD